MLKASKAAKRIIGRLFMCFSLGIQFPGIGSVYSTQVTTYEMGNAAHAPFLEDRRGVKSNGGRITSGVGGSNLARFAQYCDVFVSSVTSSAARLSARGQSRGVEKPAWRAAQNSRFSTALGMTASLYFAKPNSDAISLPGQD